MGEMTEKAKATTIVSLMVLSAFIGIAGSFATAGPTGTGSRQLEDAAPMTFVKQVGWYYGDLVQYWDFYETSNTQTMPIYYLYYQNGTQVDQGPIFRYIRDGIFNDTAGDMEYSPFLEVMNVTVEDSYPHEKVTSYQDILDNMYPISATGMAALGVLVANNSVFVGDDSDIYLLGCYYEHENITIVGLTPPATDHNWYNYTSGAINTTLAYKPDTSGHKPIFENSSIDGGWSPALMQAEVILDTKAMVDEHRDFTDFADILASDPVNNTIGETGIHIVKVDDVVPGPTVYSDLPAVEYEAHEAWVDDQLVNYYDFGETPTYFSMAYHFINESGDMLDPAKQLSILENIGPGVLDGHDGDDVYSHFVRIINVTVPDLYEYNYINSVDIIDLWNLTVEVTDEVYNCPTVPKGSSFEGDLAPDAGPYSGWYNMQEVNVVCFDVDDDDPNEWIDLGGGEVVPMGAGVFNASGHRPVVEHYNSTSGYSPLWNVTYLEPGFMYIVESVRNYTGVEEILANTTAADFEAYPGPLVNRPFVGDLSAGPTVFGLADPVDHSLDIGWHEGDQVEYAYIGPSAQSTAPLYIFFHENASDDNTTAVEGQQPIINNIPDGVFNGIAGDAGYTGFWRINKVIVNASNYDINSIRGITDLMSSGLTIQETEYVLPCGVVPGPSFSELPTVMYMPIWYKNNGAYAVGFGEELDEDTYDAVNDEVKYNKVYYMPDVDDQLPIFDVIPEDVDNYTTLWMPINITAPAGYEANELRDAADVEAMLADPQSGFLGNEEDLQMIPIYGAPITTGIAPMARAGADIVTKQMVPVTLNASASTDNVGIVSWTWNFTDNGTEVSLDGEVLDYTFEEMGSIVVTLTVKDGEDLNDTDVLTVTVLDGVAPTAVAGNDTTVELGEPLGFDGGDSTDNVNITEFFWDFGDGYNATGETVNHTYAEVGTYTVTLTATDDEGNWDNDTMTVTVIPPNKKPTINPIPDAEVTLGTTFTYTVQADDEDATDVITFALVRSPTGMTINENTGLISFTPTAAQVGSSFIVEVEASDGKDNATRSFTLSVKPAIPATIDVVMGPIKDKGGKNLKGVTVTITYSGETRDGKTIAGGTATITVPGTWIGKLVSVKLEKKDYDTETFQGTINADGTFSPSDTTYPKMEAVEAEDEGPDYSFLVIAIIILVVLALVLVSMRKPAEEEEAEEDEEEDEELDEEE